MTVLTTSDLTAPDLAALSALVCGVSVAPPLKSLPGPVSPAPIGYGRSAAVQHNGTASLFSLSRLRRPLGVPNYPGAV